MLEDKACDGDKKRQVGIKGGIKILSLGAFTSSKFPLVEQHYPQFSEKRTTMLVIHREFPFHLIFLSGFLEFSVEWLAFQKFNNFRI